MILQLATLILLTAIKQLRKVNRLTFVCITLALISLAITKTFCDFICGKTPNVFGLAVALAILPVIFVLCVIPLTLKPDKLPLYSGEKRLIRELLKDNEPYESLLNDNCFSDNPFKRIEYLATQKGFNEQGFSDFNINPSHVERCVNDLLKKDLSLEDRQQANEIYNAFLKYKLKNLSDFERDDFSTNLQKLI